MSADRELRGRLDDWRGLLRRQAQGRQILRKLLKTPLTFTPAVDGDQAYYRFEAKVRFDRLIAGLALPQVLASPTGTALALEAEIALAWEVAA